MAILIANLGTSDLAVQIEGSYFPIFFDRNERNLILPPKGSKEDELWSQRNEYVKTFLCDELKLSEKASFRDLTEKILEAYQLNPDEWHQRLRPGRIWGVITTAREKFQVNKVYFFVTDQPETEEQGYPTDTINLFEILNEWFKRKIPGLKIELEKIPKEIKPVDQDALFNHYYKRLSQVTKGQKAILISIKGGTIQMQIALRMQAMAMVEFQVNIEPELDITKVLAGEASLCQLTSYWQYIRSQKYLSVQQLLQERWDFDGSIQMLKDWQNYLQMLIKNKAADKNVANNSSENERIILALNIAIDCFNLDHIKAAKELNKPENIRLKESSKLHELICGNNYDKLLNLYTQCRIYWQLNQVANFLSRMSSFYEETLLLLIESIDNAGVNTCIDGKLDKWRLNIPKLQEKSGGKLWLEYKNLESPYNQSFRNHPFAREPIFELKGRPTKRNLIRVLLQICPEPVQNNVEIVLQQLEKLDFWASVRNELIHRNQGVSKTQMDGMLKDNRLKNSGKGQMALVACDADDIECTMASICQPHLGFVKPEYERFVGGHDFYIYSQVRSWVVRQLQVSLKS
jgi:hypothetical protein